ncbi:Hypothetical predicted protein, partial [Pelobates cultripes]
SLIPGDQPMSLNALESHTGFEVYHNKLKQGQPNMEEKLQVLQRGMNIILCTQTTTGKVLSPDSGPFYNKTHTYGSHLKTTPQKTSWLKSPVLGTYQCGKCKACRFIRRPSKTFPDSLGTQEFKVKNFFNCQSKGLIYLLSCSCKKLYVGKTFRMFKLRIREHVNSVNPTRQIDTPISKHLKLHHGGSSEGIRFSGIERVTLGPRGGDLDKKLLQRESFWIYKLKTL